MKWRQYPYFMEGLPLFYVFLILKSSLVHVSLYMTKKMHLADCSVLELYILVSMKRLEVKELELCNFNAIMKGVLKFWAVCLYCVLWNSSLTIVIHCRVQKHTWYLPNIRLLCTECMPTGVYSLLFNLLIHLRLKIYVHMWNWFTTCRLLSIFWNVHWYPLRTTEGMANLSSSAQSSF